MKRKRKSITQHSDFERFTAEFFFRLADIAQKVDPIRYSHFICQSSSDVTPHSFSKLWWVKGINTLSIFLRLLKKYDFVEKSLSFEDFSSHFLDVGHPKRRIKWLGQLNQLAVLFNTVLLTQSNDKFQDGFIKYVDEINVVISEHFVDKSGMVISSNKIKSARGNGAPGKDTSMRMENFRKEFEQEAIHSSTP